MANEEHLKILKQGVEAWNEWREENPKVTPDLNDADLSGADLRDADLSKVDLKQANLIGVNLDGSNLSGANLSGAIFHFAQVSGANLSGAKLTNADFSITHLQRANLSGADLEGAIFRLAMLAEANLSGADLRWANLTGADLDKVQLSGSTIGGTTFGNIDLRGVKGLDLVKHDSPSTIGIDTIYRSRGKISEVFLKGAGVPESFLTYMGSLVVEPIEFYSCFISYSSKDEDFARRLHADLREHKVRVWYAPEDLEGGKKLHEQIDQAIRVYDKLLLVLSENSMNSEWVATEIYKARQRELREKRRILFPIRLVSIETISDWELFDADTGKDLAREVRDYFIPDFQEWKEHDQYEKAFERLLKDLR